VLIEVTPPTALRSDLAATTLMDEEGSTYLMPYTDYDFHISEELHTRGLQDGEVVYDLHDHPVAIKYPAETDLVSLPAVINASVGLEGEDAFADVEQTIILFADLVKKIKDAIGVAPEDVAIDALAVDRTKNVAVLLPPFKMSHEATVQTALESLYQHALSRAHTYDEQYLIQQAWQSARVKVGE
jgi:hypothetical protein